ncbi:MAG: ABC transporter permease [Planctomycetota bacterium]|nr:ABC transporter permease [Planctomycetota bacterium]
MLRFILRRLGQAVLTIFGVMLISFLLFRGIAGDIAAIHAGDKSSEQYKAEWRHRHGYDLPLLLNVHRRLVVEDKTSGPSRLEVLDVRDRNRFSRTGDVLELILSDDSDHVRLGRYVRFLSAESPVEELTGGKPLAGLREKKSDPQPGQALLKFTLSDGKVLEIDVTGSKTVGQLIRRINESPQNIDPATHQKLVESRISDWTFGDLFDAQFWPYLLHSVTFQARSLKNNQKLTDIIAERAPYSLSLTIPAMAVGWLVGMVISCFVAYYRDSVIDRLGVLLSVLGMCIPFLAFMIIGQWVMFRLAPDHAYGLTTSRANIYAPVAIMVFAGLGRTVRFYRTVILDETGRDYVRTALAKGVSVQSVLFKHVLKNCMLPILTNLILSIPFLIMGSLLVESYFGISGLGDLFLTSIQDGDEPIMNGLVFLTALIYTIGLLVTDLSYAVFDPRIRLQ